MRESSTKLWVYNIEEEKSLKVAKVKTVCGVLLSPMLRYEDVR